MNDLGTRLGKAVTESLFFDVTLSEAIVLSVHHVTSCILFIPSQLRSEGIPVYN